MKGIITLLLRFLSPCYFFLFSISLSGAPNEPICLVTNTNDAGPGSLRAAISCADFNPDPDTILFAIPATGPHTILLTGDQLIINGNDTVIDGFSQSGGNEYDIIIDGSQMPIDSTAFLVHGDNIEIRGLQLQNFSRDGLYSLGADNLTITDCQVTGNGINGLSFRNSPDLRLENNNVWMNGADGIWIDNCQSLLISNNEVYQNGMHGINIDDSNNGLIEGNNSSNNGTAASELLPQSSGIILFVSSNNTISQNILNDSPYEGGLLLFNDSNNNIVLNNTISGNQDGIWLGGDGSSNNQIRNNTIEQSQEYGILITSASNDNEITGNIINANESYAVRIENGIRNFVAENNMLGNTEGGISLEDGGNNEISSPVICRIDQTSIAGSVDYTATLHVYEAAPDNNCQGFNFIGSVIGLGDSDWEINGNFDPAKKYAVTATDLNNNTSEFHCSDIPNLIPAVDTSICEGENIQLDAGIGYDTYLWSTGETTRFVFIDEENVYSVTVTNDDCEFNDEFQLITNELPEIIVNPLEVLYCNETITLDASASSQGAEFDYLWTTSDGNILTGPQTLTPGINDSATYSLQITNLNTSCAASTDVVVKSDTLTQADAGPDATICSDAHQLEANQPPGTVGEWSFPNIMINGAITDSSTLISGLSPGENIFTWTLSTTECPAFSSDEVIITLDSVLAQQDDYILFLGDDLRNFDVTVNDILSTQSNWKVSVAQEPSQGILAEGSPGFFNYFPEIGFIGMDTFRYELCNLDCDTCDLGTVIIQIKKGKEAEENAIITPNGDGINDDFAPDVLYQFPENHFQVFNRWGEKVYDEKNYAGGWYGKNQGGEDLPEATYYYNLILSLGNQRKIYGAITIKR